MSVNGVEHAGSSVRMSGGSKHSSAGSKGTMSQPQGDPSLDVCDQREYLEAHVFPCLLPGIEALLKTVKKLDSNLEGTLDVVNPTQWLAHVLFPCVFVDM
jgi:hypothetical protein